MLLAENPDDRVVIAKQNVAVHDGFVGGAGDLDAGRGQVEGEGRAEAARAHGPDVPRHLLELSRAFDAAGVRYGSHGDPDGETRERYRMLGARIAAFPSSTAAAV